ncbi:MAG: CPBP family intramembrane metalloprotease [Candidatus Dormibacteraeota bacterium]|nr:CPBP family intramembrane metalloprotease [Candidatus Dormibacteraeota bacterium]
MNQPATRGLAPRHVHATVQAAVLTTGVAAAVSLRIAAGGSMPAASYPAAILFAGALMALSFGAGWRFTVDRHWRGSVGAGIAGAAVLVLAWATAAPHVPLTGGQHLGMLLVWSPVVALVAAAEEVALRGALFGALLEAGGAPLAIAVTSVAFGLMHVPLYGWGALPLDVAAGVLLGGLRLLSGGVAAPAVAHVLADLAGGWLG